MTTIVTHTRVIEVPGIRRAREMKRWMSTVKCPACREADTKPVTVKA